ncbi:MAG: 16S rRNA (cytidine(1402)-2'-O)-methyltransferase [Thermovibrio sp.]|nr:MAG: 16S rRNA (cytidine(1402)-2'-O)-methyltransferase [Thermovibrio sp.]
MHSSKGIGKLFVVATPIGNLEDITLRALRVLKEVDLIACEDTRRTLKLLNYYGIKGKKLVSYHEHNEERRVKGLIEELRRGKSIALVSDAGTPCISDPGYRIVSLARREGIDVVPVPGPSAVVAALSASGFPTDKFFFGGFLPRKEGALRETLEEFIGKHFTSVFYESPHRLERTLGLISEIYPEIEMGVYREITKANEELLKGKPNEILRELKEKGKFKGEFVLIFPPQKVEKEEKDLDEVILEFLKKGLSAKEVSKEASKVTGLPKREIYKRVVELLND